MASFSQSEFLAMQQAKQERAASMNGPRVRYFGLNNDGDEAIVRFAYHSPEELKTYTVHSVTIDGKFRKVNCLRGLGEGADKCPLCASGQRYQTRTYIHLIEYVRNEDGSISALPRVWDRPANYNDILKGLFSEYGDISGYVFKVHRNGEAGYKQTTYNIMLANQQIYNPQTYPADFSAFENYEVIGGPVMNKTFTELQEMVGDAAEVEVPTQTFTPRVETPVQQTYNTFTPASNTTGQTRIQY